MSKYFPQISTESILDIADETRLLHANAHPRAIIDSVKLLNVANGNRLTILVQYAKLTA